MESVYMQETKENLKLFFSSPEEFQNLINALTVFIILMGVVYFVAYMEWVIKEKFEETNHRLCQILRFGLVVVLFILIAVIFS